MGLLQLRKPHTPINHDQQSVRSANYYKIKLKRKESSITFKPISSKPIYAKQASPQAKKNNTVKATKKILPTFDISLFEVVSNERCRCSSTVSNPSEYPLW